MAVLNCLVSKTFMSLELFLQKAAGLDIFEGLIFKYKVKIDLLEPLSIHFLAVLKEFANQLQYVVEETTLQKQEQFEHVNKPLVDPSLGSGCDGNLPLKTASKQAIGLPEVEETNLITVASNNNSYTNNESNAKPDKGSKTAQVKRKCKPQRKKIKLSKNQLEKGKEDLFKTLSSLKVESVFDDVKNTFVDSEQPLLVEDNDVQTFLPALEPELQELFKCDIPTSQPIPDNLPFYCCITCLEVYKDLETFEKHWCKDGETTDDGSEENERQEGSCSVTTSQLVKQVERLRAMKSFKCGLCREEYRSYDRITYHLPRCGGGPYQCELCLQEYRFKRDLNTHKKKSHRREKCFFCDECGVVFLHRTSLQKHQVNRHEQHQTMFTCEYCHQQFTKRVNLTNHNISVHKLEKKFLCQVCGNKFFTQGSLQAHLEIHSEPRKFSCAYCSKKFQQKEKLLFHTRTHTGERPHLCQTCGKRFIRKSKLDEHMRRHRGEKRFQCHVCNKCYAGNWDLKIHMKKQHSNSTDFQSETCQLPNGAEADDNIEARSTATKQVRPGARRKGLKPSTKSSQIDENQNKEVSLVKQPDKTHRPGKKAEVQCVETEMGEAEMYFPMELENDASQRIVLMDQLVVPGQLGGGDENQSRIIVLNPMPAGQAKVGDGPSRILVQVPAGVGQPDHHHHLGQQDRRGLFLQLDQHHQQGPNAMYAAVPNGMQVGALGENVATQYVQLAEQEGGGAGGVVPVVQFPVGSVQVPVSAMAQNGMPSSSFATLQSVHSHGGIVFTSSFDINSLAYIDKVVEDYR